MRCLLLSLSILLVLVAARQERESVQRVISGTTASNTVFPIIDWQVAVITNLGGGSISLCGGSIISRRFVVTAAHCVKTLSNGQLANPNNMDIIPGHERNNPRGANRGVARFWVHPSYDAGTANPTSRIDLAIIEVLSDFTYNTNPALGPLVGPIQLCTGTTCNTAGAELFVSGYGRTNSAVSSSTSNDLIYAELSFVAQSTCESKFLANFGWNLPSTNVCAESRPTSLNPARDSCFGDSGGPLVRNFGSQVSPNWFQVGVVSTGTVPANDQTKAACGEPGEYGVYVGVAGNEVWIQDVTNGRLNNTAVDNACIQAGTCSDFGGSNDGPFLGFFPAFNWQWYYILAIVLGAVLVVVIVVACCCCAKK